MKSIRDLVILVARLFELLEDPNLGPDDLEELEAIRQELGGIAE